MCENNVNLFCDKIKSMLGASECMPFSGRYESISALFDAIELEGSDCVFLSPLSPKYVVSAVIARGVVPVFCDVVPDSITLDYKALEGLVRRVISDGNIYPRAVIADNFCGMPFASNAVKDICRRFGLILIEDCGECFGGAPFGTVGDYSLISLGRSSVFGTGGNGCLVAAMGDNSLSDVLLAKECGSGYQSIDEIYGEPLVNSVENMENILQKSRDTAKAIDDIISGSDFWLQRGRGKQKSSFGKITVIAREEENSRAALEAFEKAGLSDYVSPLHAHRKSCFNGSCRGLKDIINAAAIAPRSFSIDIFKAIHNSDEIKLTEAFKLIV